MIPLRETTEPAPLRQVQPKRCADCGEPLGPTEAIFEACQRCRERIVEGWKL